MIQRSASRHAARRIAVLAAVLVIPCIGASAAANEPSVALEHVVEADQATHIWNVGDERIFILERAGIIRIYTPADGLLPTPFLDISSQVASGGENGLFAIAFDPGFDTNGYFYVSYTSPGLGSVVSRLQVSADPNVADAASEQFVITVPQPGTTHNGGQIAFGPNDGYLYFSLGDGGGAGDANCHAQRNDVLLGKILRLDVSALPYTIPPDNPFAGANDPLDEIPDEMWAKGLRNPWRFSFDPLNGDLFIGDVGQDSREEVDFQPASSPGGENYGWKVMEGTKCHDPDPIDEDCPAGTPSCFDPAYTPPVHEFVQGGVAGLCAMTGGFVYRGSAIPDLRGRYLFGDFCTGRIWTLEEVAPGIWGNVKELVQGERLLRSFGRDADGELYTSAGTAVYKLVPGLGEHEQSRLQQSCINAMNRQGAVVARVRGRSNAECIKLAGKRKLASLGLPPGTTVQECVDTDVKNRTALAVDRLTKGEQRRCRDPQKPQQVPDFGYTSAATVGAAAVRAANRVTASLFGTDAGTSLVFEDQDAAGAHCQVAVADRVRVLFDSYWQLARAGKRLALARRPGSEPADLPEELAARVLQHVDDDSRGIVARKFTRLQTVLDGSCAGVALDQTFAGECVGATGTTAEFADCIRERVRCHFCRSFESADGLTIDCDLFDDTLADGSCPSEAEILCAAPGTGINWDATEVDCPSLLQYRLFADPSDPRQNANDDGLPYDLTTPLFSDYALKYRFVFLPPGAQATYDADAPFDFPVGTIIAKTFSFADDLRDIGLGETIIETRLLIRRSLGWEGLPYVWLPDMSDAVLTSEGSSALVSWIDAAGVPQSTTYEIPSAVECGFCHFGTGDDPIGPKARLLNRDYPYSGGSANQLDHWTAIGALAGAPASGAAPRLPVWNDPLDGTLEERARAYLESNCAHCHNSAGRAGFTGLSFLHDQPLDESYGICKEASDGGVGTGLMYALVPGAPEDSIALFRMQALSSGVKMPELSRSVVHAEGVDLVSQWILGAPGTCP